MECINNAPGAPKPVAPYSQAVRSGGLLFLSGQVGTDPETGKLAEGIEAQAKQIFENINAVLAHAGSSADKIVMTSIFLADIADFSKINELYAEFVNTEAPPARQTFAVKELPIGAIIEISVVVEA